MIFNTWIFGFFLLAAFAAYWLLPSRSRPFCLLAAGIVFYTYYFPPYMLLIALLTVVVYLFGIALRKFPGRKSLLLVCGVSILVIVLGYFKYLRLILPLFGKTATAPGILVPLGLSFFIFEFIHYLVDTYHGRTKPTGLLEFGTFALFFPTLVAGPIKRFRPFIEQLREERTFKPEYLSRGAYRIMIGLAKKILLADVLTIYAEPLTGYSVNPDVGGAVLWPALIAYAFKIYFDFSGYSDIAIGCSWLFGFEIPENFTAPYLTRNISEFWRHWHISLSGWLRDYVYMPLGKKLMPLIGRKHPFLMNAICQLVTMGICGMWHGASWNFLLWGIYHGVGMIGHKAYVDLTAKFKKPGRPLRAEKLKTIIYTALSFIFVCGGWVLFVLNIGDAWHVFGKLLFINEIFGGAAR